jgi:hypothetical protein
MEPRDWSKVTALGATLVGVPACCVGASTLVRTPSGPRRLGDLVLGDEVLAFEIESGELVATPIVGMRIAQRECMKIVHAGGELVCTPDHPIYCPESGEYEPASRWVDGVRTSVLLVGEGAGAGAAEIAETEAFVGVHEVVDITVDAPMHNFVAGGVLVHNKSYDTSLYASIEGPLFKLDPDDLNDVFEIRACVEGRDPSASASSLQIDVLNGEDPKSHMGDMQFAIRLEQDGQEPLELVDQEVGGHPYMHLDSLRGACLSPLSIAFDRTDDLPDGAIVFSWELWGTSEPPSGTDFEDQLILEITEVPEG